MQLVMTTVEVQETQGWMAKLNLPGLGSYVGDAVADRAKQIVPVDTSALKGSIRYDTVESSWTLVRMVISANTYYALYVEKGTILTRAQPYLMPALKPGVQAALKAWEPGEKKPANSGKTITAEEARRSRTGAVEVQKRRDAKAAKNAQAPNTPANTRSE